jgi:hypothetical protein
MIEDVIIKGNINLDIDPYTYYYKSITITKNIGINTCEEKINFENIKEYMIGNDIYTLTYNSNPEKEYDRLYFEYGQKMYITDDHVKELTKDLYVDIIKRYGEHMMFDKIPNKQVEHEN